MNLGELTVSDARKALDAKACSARELADAHLAKIAHEDAGVHAFLEVWEKEAQAEADEADRRIARGEQKTLTGIPIALKDNILIKGRHASSASKILENYVASYDATVIEKLKAEDAVFLGRTNMDEFAMGSSTENSAFGPTQNPAAPGRVPGGSSGGSAAAVASGMALAALGSDTGGSIREPASFCGVVGMKPTYGAVSRFGLMAMGSSLDQIGPLAKTVADARLVFEAIQGRDPRDSTSHDNAPFSKAASGKVIGVPRAALSTGVDADVLARFEETLTALGQAGYEIRDIELPNISHSLAVYYVVMPAEASTNFARFDGIRYGLSVDAETIADVYTKTRGAGFGREVRRRILLGAFVLSSGYVDAYYRKARAVRALIRRDFAHAFEGVAAIAFPACPTPAFSFGEKSDPLAMYAADIFTVPMNLAGIPAISIPSRSVERGEERLPVGFQLVAPWDCEEILFNIAEDTERAVRKSSESRD